ncbi:hypothetical protein SAMN05216184_11439 [Georgenia satyanarayanai]|uniref:Uncharacterized protein n=1 Tax=Georgenia satyanarayanai TaxID=860221 RepID=A0A2Y9AM09_9MICO|nr:hypothetical protein [Georgenia satyanarayanai]PYF97774.1 hypothetical protein A8987_11439 [Georgenia satyanarayanai]SSA45514.1 hypothetical protein SAMN05216184_11439 [Georgenia satyanarayanai]
MKRTRMWAAGLAGVLVAGSVATPAIGAAEAQPEGAAVAVLEQEDAAEEGDAELEEDQTPSDTEVPEAPEPEDTEPSAAESDTEPAPADETDAEPDPLLEETVEPQPTEEPDTPTAEEPADPGEEETDTGSGDGLPKYVGNGPGKDDASEVEDTEELPDYWREASLPVPPTFKDLPGTEDDTISFILHHGLEYQVKVDDEWVPLYGATWRARQFAEYVDGKATIHMRVVVAEGFRPQPEWDEQRSEWTKVFTDAEELTTVDFVAPTRHDAPGHTGDVVIIPDAPGLQYYIGTGHEPAAPGTHNVGHFYNGDPEWISYSVPVRVEVLAGYVLNGDDDGRDLTLPFRGDEYSEDRGEEQLIEFVNPEIIDLDGTENDAVVIPDVEGLRYQIGHLSEVDPGTYLIGERATDDGEDRYSVFVSASPLAGYYFDGAESKGFEARFTKELVADLPNVSAVDNPGLETDYLILGEARGITYVIDGEEWPAGTYSVPVEAYTSNHGTAVFYEVDVLVQEGYDIPGFYDFTPGLYDTSAALYRQVPTPEPVDPGDGEDPGDGDEQPGSDDPVVVDLPAVERIVVDGAEGYALPQFSGGFDWFVNGTDVATLAEHGWANFVPAPGGGFSVATTGGLYQVTTETLEVDSIDDIVIAARAHDGYTLSTGGGEPAETVYVHDSRQDAEIAAPTVNDGPGREDSYTIPDVPGLVFLDIDETPVAPGTYPVTAEYVDGVASEWLFATALPGYRLTFGGEVGDSEPGEAAIFHVELTFTDVPGPEGGDDEDEETGEDEGSTPGDGEGEPGTPDTGDSNDGGTTPVVITPVDDSDEDTPPTGGKPADAGDPPGAPKVGETDKLADTGAGQAGALAAVSSSLILAAWLVLRGRRDQVI